MVKKLIIFMTFCILALPLVGGTVDTISRLESFLFHYCKTYESKDLDKFAALFTPDAIENNRPFHLLLPKYRENMDMIESFNYWIKLTAYSLQPDTGNVKIKGIFSNQYVLHGGTRKESSGNISMELIDNGESYLIKKLDYTN